MLEQNVCDHLGIKPEQLLVCREDGEEVVVVVDNGIKGCPKYRIPMADLDAVDEPADAENSPLAEIDQAATDAAIKLAAESGIDLADVAGTGKDGTITVGDVRRAISDAGKVDGESPEQD